MCATRSTKESTILPRIWNWILLKYEIVDQYFGVEIMLGNLKSGLK